MEHPNTYGLNKILEYLKDLLSKKERYDFDKNISKDPFLADAMDGFDQLTHEELEQDFKLLNTRLEQRIHKKKAQRLLPIISIAASIALLLGIGSIILFTNINHLSENKLAQETSDTEFNDSTTQPYLPPEEAKEFLDEFETDEEITKPVQSTPTQKKPATKIKSSTPKAAKHELFVAESAKPNVAITSETDDELTEIELLEFEDFDNDEIAIDDALSENASGSSIEKQKFEKSKRAKHSIAKKETESKPTIIYNIQGSVIDADTKEPIPGANIVQNNSGTSTDMDGKFNFKIYNDSMINIAFIGYKTKEISVNELIKNDSKIELQADQLALDEVVTIGYGVQKKLQPTGSSVTIKPNSESPANNSFSTRTKNVRINYNSGLTKHAEPLGGIKAYGKYIEANSKLKPKNKQKVILEFMVYNNGRLGTITVIKTDGNKYSLEAIQLVKEGPEWTPAQNNIGEKFDELVNLKITFNAEK